MNIALYFGSFNPIHNGHVQLVEYCLNNSILNIDEVWLILTPHNPFKNKENLLPDYLRLELAKKTFYNNKNVKILDIEFNLPQPNYTYQTILYLKENNLIKEKFYFLIGQDNFNTIENWKNYKIIVENSIFLVYPRNNLENISKNNIDYIVLKQAPQINISSTEIRESFINSNFKTDYIPQEIIPLLVSYYKKK